MSMDDFYHVMGWKLHEEGDEEGVQLLQDEFNADVVNSNCWKGSPLKGIHVETNEAASSRRKYGGVSHTVRAIEINNAFKL